MRLSAVDFRLKIKSHDNTKKDTVTLVSSYHPTSSYKKKTLSNKTFIKEIPPSNTIIIGMDLDAAIRTCLSPSINTNNDFNIIQDLLGPHRNPYQNDRGLEIQNIMRKLDLRAASTFFNSKGKHNTWISPS